MKHRARNRETVPHNTLVMERLILQAGDHIFAARLEKPDAREMLVEKTSTWKSRA